MEKPVNNPEWQALDFAVNNLTSENWIRIPFSETKLDLVVKLLVGLGFERVQDEHADWFKADDIEPILLEMQCIAEDSRPKVIVSGSRSIRQLPEEAIARMGTMIEKQFQILVGDAEGVDTLVQNFFKSRNYYNVRVHHIGKQPRYNAGFRTVPVVGRMQSAKDRAMCTAADYGLAIWDGQSKGTRENIGRVQQTRVIQVQVEELSPV